MLKYLCNSSYNSLPAFYAINNIEILNSNIITDWTLKTKQRSFENGQMVWISIKLSNTTLIVNQKMYSEKQSIGWMEESF